MQGSPYFTVVPSLYQEKCRHRWEFHLHPVSNLQFLYTPFHSSGFPISQGLTVPRLLWPCPPLLPTQMQVFLLLCPTPQQNAKAAHLGPRKAMIEIVLHLIVLRQTEEVAVLHVHQVLGLHDNGIQLVQVYSDQDGLTQVGPLFCVNLWASPSPRQGRVVTTRLCTSLVSMLRAKRASVRNLATAPGDCGAR